MSAPRGSVPYGKETIEFSIFYVDRKTMEIAVHPDRTVVVKAPVGVGHDRIRARVARRAGWIARQLDYFLRFEPRTPVRRFVGGETHLYLGRRYRLKIAGGTRDSVKLIRGYFEIEVKGGVSPEKVKWLLEGWYRNRAEEIFREGFDRCWQLLGKGCSIKPRLQIMPLRKRWGSLSAKGRLTLNLDLIRAPRECIDYVITHELSHLLHKNHGPGFFRLLDKLMPDWEKRKHRLEVTLA